MLKKIFKDNRAGIEKITINKLLKPKERN